MEILAVSIPTAIGTVSVEIPPDYPIPSPGGDFYFNFESVVNDLEEWEAVCSVLENNSLTVDRVESGKVFLREGAHPKLPDVELDEFLSTLQLYWEENPWTSPPRFLMCVLLLSDCRCRNAQFRTSLDRRATRRTLKRTYPRL